MDDEQKKKAFRRVEALAVKILGTDEPRVPLMGESLSEHRCRGLLIIVNLLLTGPDAPRERLQTGASRVMYLAEKLGIDPMDAELLLDVFEQAAREYPRDYPDVGQLLKVAKQMAASRKDDDGVRSFFTPASRTRH